MDKENLTKELAKALAWLDSRQNAKAILSHHGMVFDGKIGHQTISLSPQGESGYPVIIFVDDRKNDDSWEGYTREEIVEFLQVVESLVEVRDSWNGVGYSTFSISLSRFAGKYILKCVENYRKAGANIFRDGWWKNQIRTIFPDGWSG
jgi:hypothetical protein